MRHVAARLLRSLLAHPRSLRTFDETLLDIESERLAAATPGEVAQWTLRSVLALARTLVLVVPGEMASIPLGDFLGKATFLTVVFAGALMARPTWDYVANGVPASVIPLLIPQTMQAVLPLTLFWAVLWSDRRRRIPIGVLAALAGSLVLAATLAYPIANQAFREATWRALVLRSGSEASLQRPSPVALRGLSEMSVRELVAAWTGTRPVRMPLQQHVFRELMQRTAFVPVAAALALLAGVWRFASARRRWIYACMPIVLFWSLLFVLRSPPLASWAFAALAFALAVRGAWRQSPNPAHAVVPR